MSDFKQAIKWIKQGQKVRGKFYVSGDYVYLGNNDQIFYWDSKEGKGSWLQFTLTEIEATDWEIYEEESKMTEFKLFFYSQEEIKKQIEFCEGKHIQQVAYSSYHDALTQICFGCKKIRTSLKKEDLKK